MSALPVLVLFAVFQKKIIAGLEKAQKDHCVGGTPSFSAARITSRR